MAGETIITVVGNLTADPELRFTQSGAPVASFTVASTPRRFDKQRNEWIDGEPMFLRTSVWNDQAENVAESLEKGARVVVQGRLGQRSFTDRDGNDRTTIELQADEVAPSLKYATAKPQRTPRNGNSNGGGGSVGGGNARNSDTRRERAGNDDPWAGGGNQGGYDDPPF